VGEGGEGEGRGVGGEVEAFLLSLRAGDNRAKSHDELQTALALLRKAVALDQDREHIERRLRNRILLLEEEVVRSKTDSSLYQTECDVMRRRGEVAEREMKAVVKNLKEEVSDEKRLLEETKEALVQSQEQLSDIYRRQLLTQQTLEHTQQTLDQSEERLQNSEQHRATLKADLAAALDGLYDYKARQKDYDDVVAAAARMEKELELLEHRNLRLSSLQSTVTDKEEELAVLHTRLARAEARSEEEEARADKLRKEVIELRDVLVRKTALLEAAERVKEHEKELLRQASQRLFFRVKGDGPIQLEAQPDPLCPLCAGLGGHVRIEHVSLSVLLEHVSLSVLYTAA
jgi:DNA repair exonuclease SbcCD ATPase subunit